MLRQAQRCLFKYVAWLYEEASAPIRRVGVDVERSSRIAGWAFHLGLECRVIAGRLSSVHVMISPDLAIGNAAFVG
jgi:hypothetical protein